MVTALVGDMLASGNWYEQAKAKRRQLICGIHSMVALALDRKVLKRLKLKHLLVRVAHFFQYPSNTPLAT